VENKRETGKTESKAYKTKYQWNLPKSSYRYHLGRHDNLPLLFVET